MDHKTPVENADDMGDHEFNPLDDPEERQVVYKAINSFQ
jgi:hypothetical protein